MCLTGFALSAEANAWFAVGMALAGSLAVLLPLGRGQWFQEARDPQICGRGSPYERNGLLR